MADVTRLKSGVVFSSDAYNAGPSYIFTKISDLKGDMLAEATKRAREAAQKFAEESGAKVGDIQTANQGIFEIKPLLKAQNISAAPLAVGLLAAAGAGYLSIALLLRFLRARTTQPFVIYRIALGTLLIALLASGKLLP